MNHELSERVNKTSERRKGRKDRGRGEGRRKVPVDEGDKGAKGREEGRLVREGNWGKGTQAKGTKGLVAWRWCLGGGGGWWCVRRVVLIAELQSGLS
jgi:hypothetical protein